MGLYVNDDFRPGDFITVNGKPVRSCITPISEVEGKKIRTIEGLGQSNITW